MRKTGEDVSFSHPRPLLQSSHTTNRYFIPNWGNLSPEEGVMVRLFLAAMSFPPTAFVCYHVSLNGAEEESWRRSGCHWRQTDSMLERGIKDTYASIKVIKGLMRFSPTTQPLIPLPWAFPVVGERTAVAVKFLQRGRYGIEYNTGRGTKSGKQRPIMSILLPAFTFHELLLSCLIIIIAEYCKFIYLLKSKCYCMSIRYNDTLTIRRYDRGGCDKQA